MNAALRVGSLRRWCVPVYIAFDDFGEILALELRYTAQQSKAKSPQSGCADSGRNGAFGWVEL